MKKSVGLLLSAAMFCSGFSGLAGCGTHTTGSGGGVSIDPSKEVISISLFSAGFGTQWLDDLLNDYNATLTGNYQFNRIPENTNSIDTITDQLEAGIRSADIYFNDTSDFQRLMRSEGMLLDLTSVWESKPDGTETTVRDKILDSDVYERAYSYDGKIYGIPFSQGMSGIIYDHDLFEDANFFARDDSTENGLTVGIDGIEGTFDDGLPVTMEEFIELCDTIKGRNYWPFIYTDTVGGGITTPVMEIIVGLYEGLESYEATIIYDGTYTSPSTGVQTEITPAEGYRAFEIGEGRVKAVEFLNDVLLNEKYFDSSIQGINHTASEEYFLYSHSAGRTRIAMTLNGCWWENEARDAFATDARRNGAKWGYGMRDFRFLPMPAVEEQSESMNGKYVFSTNADGSVFALRSDDEEKNQAILDFLTYFTSDEGLSYFARETGSMPAYRFELSDEDYEAMTPFSRNQYDYLMNENTVILRPNLIEQLTPINYLTTNSPQRWSVVINGFEYELAYDAIKRTSAEQYLTALQTKYNADSWSAIYSQVEDVLS